MNKSNEAFRTISEVADELGIQKHVLRFWEVKFPQIKPMKRGGGRRYYRPEDVVLLRGIRHLLHAENYQIKGVQKILRDKGVDEVKAYANVQKKTGRAAPEGARASLATVGRVRGLGKKRGRQTPVDVSAVIASALRELQTCRDALVAAAHPAVPAATPARKAARAAR